MFKSAMFCHVHNFDSTELAISRLIQVLDCALNRFTMKQVHKPKLVICHLHGLGSAYPKHVICC